MLNLILKITLKLNPNPKKMLTSKRGGGGKCIKHHVSLVDGNKYLGFFKTNPMDLFN